MILEKSNKLIVKESVESFALLERDRIVKLQKDCLRGLLTKHLKGWDKEVFDFCDEKGWDEIWLLHLEKKVTIHYGHGVYRITIYEETYQRDDLSVAEQIEKQKDYN